MGNTTEAESLIISCHIAYCAECKEELKKYETIGGYYLSNHKELSVSKDLWKKSAEIHFKLNFFKEASIACQNANELGNHDFKMWIIWMDAQMYLKEWQAALSICQLALQYFNNRSSILYRLAGCKMRLGKKDEAISIFDKIKSNLNYY